MEARIGQDVGNMRRAQLGAAQSQPGKQAQARAGPHCISAPSWDWVAHVGVASNRGQKGCCMWVLATVTELAGV